MTKPAREFLRLAQLRPLKGASGKLDYNDAGEELEALEFREMKPNR